MIKLLLSNSTIIRSPGYLSILLKINHFDILGVNKNYNINKNTIENTYKDVQQAIKPYKEGQDTNIKVSSEFLSNCIKESYTTIIDDYKRSLYMLLLEGVEIKESDKLTNTKDLEGIIEINEKIEEGTYKLMALKEEVKDKIEEIKYDFNEAMENKDFDKAKEKCILLSYYINADNAIYEKINEV